MLNRTKVPAHAPRGPKPRDVRERAGLSLIEAAVGSKSAENTVRLYEADRDSVSARKRAELDAYYAGLASDDGGRAA